MKHGFFAESVSQVVPSRDQIYDLQCRQTQCDSKMSRSAQNWCLELSETSRDRKCPVQWIRFGIWIHEKWCSAEIDQIGTRTMFLEGHITLKTTIFWFSWSILRILISKNPFRPEICPVYSKIKFCGIRKLGDRNYQLHRIRLPVSDYEKAILRV